MGRDSVSAEPAHVEVRNLSKSFGGVHAVRGNTLSVQHGEIHALVGENGAGKSTLAKMIAGVLAPSEGQILVRGQLAEFQTPRQALAKGISIIEQELGMVPERSVLDNVFLGNESKRRMTFDGKEQEKRYGELTERTGFDLDPNTLAGSLRVADQQVVEILRALARSSDFVIMDEPTAPLTQVESDRLYEVIRELKRRGTTIVFISHFLEEVLGIADTVTIMRDGAVVRTGPAAQETPDSLVQGMLGRSMELIFPEQSEPGNGEPVLEVRELSAPGRFEEINFTVNPGEIVGIAGLVGSGRSEVVRGVFGADPVDSGEVLVDGNPLPLGSPRAAIDRGLVMLPESRKDDGLVLMRSVAENLVLARLGEVSSGGMLRRRSEREEVSRLVNQLDIKTEGIDAPVDTLSGGNQQKVLFAKWLMCKPRVFIVDEPTRGVDVGAKRAIYELMSELASDGMAVLFISSEIEEVLGLAHRVLVMRRGRIAASMTADEASEEAILAAAFGTQVAA